MLEAAQDDSPPTRTTMPAKRPAHRPSRRLHIIEAATAVFSREGYVAANLEDIARAAGVAPTAIYYHFGGKEQLFNQALRTAMDGFSDQVYGARPDYEPGSVEALRAVLRAGWEWYRANPSAARLVSRYSESSTAGAVKLRQEWEDRHLARAYDYVSSGRSSRSNRKAREQYAAHSLAMRILLDVILITQASLLDGSLGRVSRAAAAEAAEEICVALTLSMN